MNSSSQHEKSPQPIWLVMFSVISVMFAAAPIACFSPPSPDCAYLCSSDKRCPDGYYCAQDGACKRNGVAETFDCGFVAPVDAGPAADAGSAADAAAAFIRP